MAELGTQLSEILNEKGYTLSFAESCTGGLLSKTITDIPGSSSFFLGSAVTYSNDAKMDILGVREGTLIEHGAVSEPTAIEMAEGARNAFSSDVSASVTGIAGPGGGTPEKPVGTVWTCVIVKGRTETRKYQLKGDREQIRQQTVDSVLSHIIRMLEDNR